METRVRPVVVPVLLVLALGELLNLVAGVHYVSAAGGFPVETKANHLGGWIHLAAAACVLVGIVLVVRSPRHTWRILVAGLLAVVLAIGGLVAGQTTIRDGGRCACEGL
jgi:hypothetical protein